MRRNISRHKRPITQPVAMGNVEILYEVLQSDGENSFAIFVPARSSGEKCVLCRVLSWHVVILPEIRQSVKSLKPAYRPCSSGAEDAPWWVLLLRMSVRYRSRGNAG